MTRLSRLARLQLELDNCNNWVLANYFTTASVAEQNAIRVRRAELKIAIWNAQ